MSVHPVPINGDAAPLDSLLQKAAQKRSQGPRCWARTAPDYVKEFIAAVQARMAAGEDFHYSQIAKVLKEDLNFPVNNVARHLRGDCSCE